MNLTGGLCDRIVLQRDGDGFADARFEGATAASGAVEARVLCDGAVVEGFEWIEVGRAANGRFAGRLQGLRAGGPYEITLRIRHQGEVATTCAVRDVLVGDVWLLGGQSQMQGAGFFSEDSRLEPHPHVRAQYMDDQWDVAREPLHNMEVAVDPVHALIDGGPPTCEPFRQQGPGFSFGLDMQRRAGVPQGLIPCAHSGTSMQQWDPAEVELGGASLFGAMIRRLRHAGGRVKGVIWAQGESDATAECAPHYGARMRAFIEAVRRHAGDPGLPFVMAQIARSGDAGEDRAAWNSIQEQQRRLGDEIHRCALVPTIDLELDDTIHYGGAAQVRLGRRLADAAWSLTGDDQTPRPIRLAKVTLQSNPWRELAVFDVQFHNVVGRLVAGSRPEGFAVLDASGRPLPSLYRTRLHGDRVHLLLYHPARESGSLRPPKPSNLSVASWPMGIQASAPFPASRRTAGTSPARSPAHSRHLASPGRRSGRATRSGPGRRRWPARCRRRTRPGPSGCRSRRWRCAAGAAVPVPRPWGFPFL
ncbi:MAG: sialate O-acetylesterase [Planctomycetes bacterium]|nr:sialate O-acetylesterase [Planctomycetota bacterium]